MGLLCGPRRGVPLSRRSSHSTIYRGGPKHRHRVAYSKVAVSSPSSNAFLTLQLGCLDMVLGLLSGFTCPVSVCLVDVGQPEICIKTTEPMPELLASLN